MPARKRFDAQISCPVTPDMKVTLEQLAVKRQTTVSQLARMAVEEFVIRETKRYAPAAPVTPEDPAPADDKRVIPV